MPCYYANLSADQLRAHQRKRVVVYAAGLKVYGLLPALLGRRLRAEFRSNIIGCELFGPAGKGGHIGFPSAEPNWTAIPYCQSPENAAHLLAWLAEAAGFEWAVAGPTNWGDDIFAPNIAWAAPQIWTPAPDGARQQGWVRVLGQELTEGRAQILALLTSPAEER